MPNRILRDGINSSGRINKLSLGAEILYRRLMSVVDDYGRYFGTPAAIRGGCWPTAPEKAKETEITRWLAECTRGERPLIRLYEAGGCRFLEITEFRQQIRSKSKFPEYAINLLATCEQPATQLRSTSRSRSSESKAESEAESDSLKWPSPELLAKYYNDLAADELPYVEKLTPARRKKAADYLRIFPDEKFWLDVFQATRASPFLRGLRPATNGHGVFRADFDWLLTRGKDGTENAIKVYEGKYANT